MSVVVALSQLLTMENITLLPLTKGQASIIDAEDAPKVLKHKWFAAYIIRRGKKSWRAYRTVYINPQNYYHDLLHRYIIDAPKGTQVDHRNGDGLDNRRTNIRIASATQNARNRHRRRNSSSEYKGVLRYTGTDKWRSYITVGDRRIYLGTFKSDEAEKAAKVYDEAARKYYGEFARLNFPRPGEQSAL